jgi:hypothetical protein
MGTNRSPAKFRCIPGAQPTECTTPTIGEPPQRRPTRVSARDREDARCRRGRRSLCKPIRPSKDPGSLRPSRRRSPDARDVDRENVATISATASSSGRGPGTHLQHGGGLNARLTTRRRQRVCRDRLLRGAHGQLHG